MFEMGTVQRRILFLVNVQEGPSGLFPNKFRRTEGYQEREHVREARGAVPAFTTESQVTLGKSLNPVCLRFHNHKMSWGRKCQNTTISLPGEPKKRSQRITTILIQLSILMLGISKKVNSINSLNNLTPRFMKFLPLSNCSPFYKFPLLLHSEEMEYILSLSSV